LKFKIKQIHKQTEIKRFKQIKRKNYEKKKQQNKRYIVYDILEIEDFIKQ
jgi:hypothetical protein